jgi:hypothetical protein
MLLIDFHKYAQKPAAQPQPDFVSAADMFLAISIRRTTLSIACKRRVSDDTESAKVDSDLVVSHSS